MKDLVINSDLINEWNWDKNNELGFSPDKLKLLYVLGGTKKWREC